MTSITNSKRLLGLAPQTQATKRPSSRDASITAAIARLSGTSRAA